MLNTAPGDYIGLAVYICDSVTAFYLNLADSTKCQQEDHEMRKFIHSKLFSRFLLFCLYAIVSIFLFCFVLFCVCVCEGFLIFHSIFCRPSFISDNATVNIL
jgi:hypothetical protein